MERSFRYVALTRTAIIVSSFILAILLIYVADTRLDVLNAGIQTYRAMLARTTQATTRLVNLKNNAAAAMGYDRIFDTLLPYQEQLLEVPRTVETIAAAQHVSALFTFAAGEGGAPVQGATGTGALSFTLTAHGPQSSLVIFLRELESRYPRYIIAVDTADITGAPDDAQLTVAGRVFYRQNQ